jgi:hypothetical protein
MEMQMQAEMTLMSMEAWMVMGSRVMVMETPMLMEPRRATLMETPMLMEPRRATLMETPMLIVPSLTPLTGVW